MARQALSQIHGHLQRSRGKRGPPRRVRCPSSVPKATLLAAGLQEKSLGLSICIPRVFSDHTTHCPNRNFCVDGDNSYEQGE